MAGWLADFLAGCVRAAPGVYAFFFPRAESRLVKIAVPPLHPVVTDSESLTETLFGMYRIRLWLDYPGWGVQLGERSLIHPIHLRESDRRLGSRPGASLRLTVVGASQM
jgi:hypothetical protein